METRKRHKFSDHNGQAEFQLRKGGTRSISTRSKDGVDIRQREDEGPDSLIDRAETLSKQILAVIDLRALLQFSATIALD